MFKETLIYILLWLLIQLLIEINCQIVPFRPLRRYRHTATLIDNKLYILGGAISLTSLVYSNDFFYLDFSGPFNTKELPWRELSNNNMIVPQHYGAASAKAGANNKTLFLYGGDGLSSDISGMALVYAYNPQSNTWSIPEIVGNNVARKTELEGIIDRSGKMYLWGGWTGSISSNMNPVNDMLILDTVNLSWGKGSLAGAPTPRVVYGALLLPDNNIIYIGKQAIIVA